MIQFPCPKSILSMTPTNNGFHCSFCNEEVMDLSSLSKDDLTKWKSENSSRCVVINEPKKNVAKLSLSHFALALLVAGGTSLFNFANAQVASSIENVQVDLSVPEDPSIGILRVNLINQYGGFTWGNAWVVLPNGKELEMYEIEEGRFYVEIPAYCKGKALHVYGEHLGKRKHLSTAMYGLSEDVEVNLKFKSRKQYRRVVGGYF